MNPTGRSAVAPPGPAGPPDLSGPRLVLATPPAAGAVAILQLHGPGAAAVLARLTGRADWPPGRVRRADLGGIDQGLAVVGPGPAEFVQIMPHGGRGVVRRLMDRLVEAGARPAPDPPARDVYPEAAGDLEADVLATLARAASPAAIDLLLAQPDLWRAVEADPAGVDAQAVLARSDVLDRLVTPPTVAVIGRPNVGKSTLTNQLLGRAASVVADLPGTTRDWVGAVAELVPVRASGVPCGAGDEAAHRAVAVRWLDTPGLRAAADALEREAIARARRVIAAADVLVAVRDPGLDWPDPADLPRTPDLRVMNKADQLPASETRSSAAGVLRTCALTGEGLAALQQAVLERLGLADLRPRLWAFSPALRQRLAAPP